MKIEILEFEEGARNAKGVTVIIDVFRAFSVECYAYNAGAEKVIATAEPELAFGLRDRFNFSVLVGERNERKIEGFDFGNSPSEIIKADLKGKTVIHTTTAGTRGLISAVNAEIVLTGSLVNAKAVVRYIKSVNPSHVSLVAMGYRAVISAEEDLLCAEIIASGLMGDEKPWEKRIAGLRNTSGKRFFIPENNEFSPPEDFFLCTDANRFDFILKATPGPEGSIILEKRMMIN